MSMIASAALLLGVSAEAQAQERDYSSASNYVSVQAGAQFTPTNYHWYDLITPQYAISAGRYFNDKVGARIHVLGFQQRGGYTHQEFILVDREHYDFKAITGNADLLINMTNVINPTRLSHKFDWVLLAGFGVNYAWDFDEYHEKVGSQQYYYGAQQCGTKHSTFNGRLGTQFNYNISDAFTVGVELQANYKNDLYNLKQNGAVDWQCVGLVGVTYNFGYKKKQAPKPEPAPVPVVVEEPKPAPAPAPVVVEEPKPAPAPAPVVKEEPLKEVFFYQIRESDPDTEAVLNKIVAWCNKYPAKGITVKGYADRGTGNPKLNVMYAQKRAEKIAKALQNKGVAADRMQVTSYGDTVQPYTENDKNRCVIVVGE